MDGIDDFSCRLKVGVILLQNQRDAAVVDVGGQHVFFHLAAAVNHAAPLGPLPYVISSQGIRRQEEELVDIAQILQAVEGCAQLRAAMLTERAYPAVGPNY